MCLTLFTAAALTSKLFSNERERLSLCYYASSTFDFTKGFMCVMSGIDKDKYDVAIGEILRQLDCVKTGDFTDGELVQRKADRHNRP